MSVTSVGTARTSTPCTRARAATVLERSGPPGGEHQRGARFGEAQGDRLADAAIGPGDQHDLAGERLAPGHAALPGVPRSVPPMAMFLHLPVVFM